MLSSWVRSSPGLAPFSGQQKEGRQWLGTLSLTWGVIPSYAIWTSYLIFLGLSFLIHYMRDDNNMYNIWDAMGIKRGTTTAVPGTLRDFNKW